jgi:hypothetical protein
LCKYAENQSRDVREHESIPVNPLWVLGIEGHKFVEEDMSSGSQAHGRSGMTGVCFERCINLEQRTQLVIECIEVATIRSSGCCGEVEAFEAALVGQELRINIRLEF